MSFEVVLCHFWGGWGESCSLFSLMRIYAVPIFMVASFFLTSKIYINKDFSKQKKRIFRILLPHAFWTVILFAANSIIVIKQTGHFYQGYYFLIQLITGSAYNSPMWYMVVLLLITIMMCIIFRFSTKWTICYIISILCFVLQYANINFRLFTNASFYIKFCFGRVVEVIPCACSGIFLSKLDIKKYKKTYTLDLIILCTVLILMFLYFDIFTSIPGFNYSGIDKNIVSILSVLLFYLMPIEKSPDFVKKLITNISHYTLGIYCIHLFMGRFFLALLGKSKLLINDFMCSIFIWCISLLFCVFTDKITKGKLKFALV